MLIKQRVVNNLQIQSAGAGDAGEYPAASYSEWWNFAPGYWLKGTAANAICFERFLLHHPRSQSFYVLCVSVLENVGSFSAQTRTNTIELLYTLPLFYDTRIISIDIK